MNGLLGHTEVTPQHFLALLLSQGRASLSHPLAVYASQSPKAGCPIPGRTYLGLSTLRPTLAEFYDVDASVVGPSVPGVGFEQGRVDVRHFLSFFLNLYYPVAYPPLCG